jgi:acetyl esterase/lipase
MIYRRLIHYYTGRLNAIPLVENKRAFIEKGTQPLRAPKGTTVEQVDVAGIPARWIVAPGVADATTILYLHGGGFVLGWNNQYLTPLAYLSKMSEARVLALDYRLAPEYPFPAALEDCLAAYHWLMQQGTPPERIAIAGDSAGGSLTLATILALRDKGAPLPCAAVCLSPGCDMTLSGASYQTRAKVDPVLSLPFIKATLIDYIGEADPRDPLLSPVFADLQGFPPLMIQAGNDEMLLSDAERMAELARAAGVETAFSIWPHMWHVFQLYAPFVPEARHAIEESATFIRRHVATSMPAASVRS